MPSSAHYQCVTQSCNLVFSAEQELIWKYRSSKIPRLQDASEPTAAASCMAAAFLLEKTAASLPWLKAPVLMLVSLWWCPACNNQCSDYKVVLVNGLIVIGRFSTLSTQHATFTQTLLFATSNGRLGLDCKDIPTCGVDAVTTSSSSPKQHLEWLVAFCASTRGWRSFTSRMMLTVSFIWLSQKSLWGHVLCWGAIICFNSTKPNIE